MWFARDAVPRSVSLPSPAGWDALRASKALVQGKWLRTAGYLFLLSCVAMLWNSVFQLICSFLGENVMADVLYQFLCYISVGFVAVGECLLYLNRKAVAEGACVFGTAFVDDVAAVNYDAPAEPVEGTVDGVAEEKTEEVVGLLENKTDEKTISFLIPFETEESEQKEVPDEVQAADR